MMGRSFFTSAMRMSALWTIWTAKAVSTMSLLRQAEMEPAAGVVVDFLGDGGGEADDVVVERFFEFALAGDKAGGVGEPLLRRRP